MLEVRHENLNGADGGCSYVQIGSVSSSARETWHLMTRLILRRVLI